ncbi:MAG: alkaline phosphatase family protein [Bryobacteraceae bacterium]|nr:alkaline phosphatase family protein [Bryobacteraceae bacterium]
MPIAALLLASASVFAQSPEQPVRAVTDPGVVTTRQSITPAGVPSIFQGRVYGVDFGASNGEIWVLGATHVWRLDWRQNKVLDRLPHQGKAGIQSLRYHAASKRAFTASAGKENRIGLGVASAGAHRLLAPHTGEYLSGAMAIAGDTVAVPLIYNNALAVFTADGTAKAKIKTEIAPYAVVLSRDGNTAWVSNWGGRLPRPNELSAPTGYQPNADKVVVDPAGKAASGTLVRIDIAKGAVTHTVEVAPHPMALAWDESKGRLYVASGNQDSIQVIDTTSNRAVASHALKPFSQQVAGIAPTAMTLSPDASRLYVACGGINAVLVMKTADGSIEGMIPTAWYPSSLALSADGRMLAIGSLLGAGSGWRDEPKKRFVHSYRGAVNVVELPDAAQLAAYTLAVAENNRMQGASAAAPNPKAAPKAVPAVAGEPSAIRHVVFIIKENRTYDQLFGDLGKGNGDPSLVLFGADVTPNQRKLAEQFVLFDNFYATGGNSADGHQWVTQANQNAYTMLPGYAGRSYPFDGSDPLAISSGGLFWETALAKGHSVRIYGEYAGTMRDKRDRHRMLEEWKNGADFAGEFNVTAPIAALNKVLAKNFAPYSLAVPDVARARIFLADLAKWQREGSMPNLVVMLLPSDHTSGASPGASTAKAMVADNDLAVGQVVEGLSKSPFWKSMAIFIVEDDAQNGVDHVDGHRTVALVASPFARRGHIDSTFYSQQSMLKTIELILGLPTLSLFDLIANDMRAAFQDTPDLTPFESVQPAQSLFEKNPPLQALKGPARKAAADSSRMKWDVPDAAPTGRLNQILWGMVKGWNTPYPGVRQAVFAPLSLDVDDDDR